jgi:hypothetical protein
MDIGVLSKFVYEDHFSIIAQALSAYLRRQNIARAPPAPPRLLAN